MFVARIDNNALKQTLYLVVAASLLLPVVVQSFPFISAGVWMIFPFSSVVFVIFFSKHEFRSLIYRDVLSILVLLLLLSFAWGLFQTNSPVSTALIKDGLRGLMAFLLIFLIACLCKDRIMSERILSTYLNVIFLVSFTAAAIGATKYFFVIFFPLQVLPEIIFGGNEAFGTSLSNERNFFSLNILLGMIATFHFWSFEVRVKGYVIYGILIGLLALIGLGTHSRRFFLTLWPVLMFCLLVFPILRARARAFQTKSTLAASNDPKWFIKTIVTATTILIILVVGFLCLSDLNDYFVINRIKSLSDPTLNHGLGSRLGRWEFAVSLLERDLTMFGNGFDYRHLYSCKFNNCKFDGYPHNNVLSSLLYGGVVGAGLTITILFYSTYISFVCVCKSTVGQTVGLSLAVVMLFCFISGDSIFSIPVFFSLLALAKLAFRLE